MRIAVVGAGHAGVEAARAAREAGAEVTLFSGEDVLPYYRPRLVAAAFGAVEFNAISIHPADWYAAQGIDLRLNAPVERLHGERGSVTVSGVTTLFNAIVLACGATPILPAFTASEPETMLPLWSVRDARVIQRRAQRGGRIVVLGGGILGIEAALRAVEAGMTVEIVERLDRLMPAQFGASASRVLTSRLSELGVTVTIGRKVTAVRTAGDSGIVLTLDDASTREADGCLLSIGARPRRDLPAASGLAVDRGVTVNTFLQTSAPRVFAAGDVVQFAGVTRCAVREALAQGRIAGANAAALPAGRPLAPYAPETLPLSFKDRNFELYAIGVPGGPGYEERLLDGTTGSVLRSLISQDGMPVGVQMIGTREGFDEYAAMVRRAQTDRPSGMNPQA